MTDLLLEWMSFRRAGRISDVPADLADGGAVRRTVDNLAVLGHVELLNGASWKVAPPALAGLPAGADRDTTAVLCGARTPGVLASLTAACQGAGAQLASLTVPNRPAVIQVTAASGAELAAVASAARIPLQHDAAFTLLACTPAIRDWPRTPCAMVDGRVETVRRFSRSRMGWVESTLAEAAAAKAVPHQAGLGLGEPSEDGRIRLRLHRRSCRPSRCSREAEGCFLDSRHADS